MKNTLFAIAFLFTTLCAEQATAQWEYFLDEPEGIYYNTGLTVLDNGYFASVGFRLTLPWGAPYAYYLTVLDTTGQEVFTRIYEEGEGINLVNVLPATDGLYLIGAKKIDSLSTNNIYVNKLNYENDIVWEVTFSQYAPFTGKGLEAILVADTIMRILFPKKSEIIGNADSTGLLEIGLDGTLLSSVLVDADDFDLHRSMALGEDGHLLITGKINDSLYLQKIDIAGNQIWKSVFGATKPREGRKVMVADDGQLILMGFQDDGQGWGGQLGRTVFMKIDNDGNLVWERTYFGASNTEGRDFCRTADGGFLLIGELGFDDVGGAEMFMLKADSNGVEQWRKDYIFTMDDVGFEVLGYNVISAGDENVVLAAQSNEAALSLYIAKIDIADEVVATEISRFSSISKLNLSPIPTASILNVELELNEKITIQLEVINAMGEIVQCIQKEALFSEGVHYFNFDASRLQSGLYQVLVHTKTGSIAKTFVKVD